MHLRYEFVSAEWMEALSINCLYQYNFSKEVYHVYVTDMKLEVKQYYSKINGHGTREKIKRNKYMD